MMYIFQLDHDGTATAIKVYTHFVNYKRMLKLIKDEELYKK